MSRLVTEWVAGLRLGPRDKAIVYSLARFADDTGVVYGLTYDDLAVEFNYSRRTIVRIMQRLKNRVGLQVEQFNLGRRKFTAFYLPIVPHEEQYREYRLSKTVDEAMSMGLTRVLRAGLTSGFHGDIGQWLLVEIEKLLEAAKRSGRIKYLPDDFKTVAWLEASERAAELVEAANPGEKLIKWVFREFNASKLDDLNLLDLQDEKASAGVVPVVYQAPSQYVVTYDDILEVAPLRQLVYEFIYSGVAPSVAFAGTLRVLQLCVSARWSYKHTGAAKDPFLRSLGIDPKTARQWVSLVIGPRNCRVDGLVPGIQSASSVIENLVA